MLIWHFWDQGKACVQEKHEEELVRLRADHASSQHDLQDLRDKVEALNNQVIELEVCIMSSLPILQPLINSLILER